MKTKGDDSSRSEPYFASFTMPTISTGPPVRLQATCDPRPSRMRKCCPRGFAAPKYFWAKDLLTMATLSEVDVSWLLKSRPPTIDVPRVSKYPSLTLLNEAMPSVRDFGV